MQAVNTNNFSVMRIPFFSQTLFNTRMKTIDEIHRERLAMLRDDCGGVGKLAERIEKSPSQVSQWLNASENSGTGKPRGISDDVCRLLEEKFEKPRGWMDADPDRTDTPMLMQLISMFLNCTEDGQAQILEAAFQAEKYRK